MWSPISRQAAQGDLGARRQRVGEAVGQAGEVGFETFITEVMKVGKRGEEFGAVLQRGAVGARLASQSNTRAGLGARQSSQACKEDIPPSKRRRVELMRAPTLFIVR